jgi:hypothetical protein
MMDASAEVKSMSSNVMIQWKGLANKIKKKVKKQHIEHHTHSFGFAASVSCRRRTTP